MKNKNYLILCITTFILGLLFLAYQKEWLVIKARFPKKYDQQLNGVILHKKNIRLFFWKNNKLKSEDTDIMISENDEENIQKITNCWLNILDEEKIIDKVTLQSTMLSQSGQEAYLSFDRPILNPETATFEKLMVIESLLKTLRHNDIKVPKIYLLAHHQEMMDSHLDFSNPWPLEGFLKG